jgi:hypothetical protein
MSATPRTFEFGEEEDGQADGEFGPATAPHRDDEENISGSLARTRMTRIDALGRVRTRHIQHGVRNCYPEKKYITTTTVSGYPLSAKITMPSCANFSVYDIEDTILRKCMFFFSCVLNHGSRNTIVYCEDTTQIEKISRRRTSSQRLYSLRRRRHMHHPCRRPPTESSTNSETVTTRPGRNPRPSMLFSRCAS